MTKEFKDKWITALRSGEYKQGTEALYDNFDNTYCCLGVACIVAGLTKESIDGEAIILKSNLPIKNNIPKELIGETIDNSFVQILIDRNDHKKWSFKQIADYIQKNL